MTPGSQHGADEEIEDTEDRFLDGFCTANSYDSVYSKSLQQTMFFGLRDIVVFEDCASLT
ncbi:hypothetical protein ACG7TL_008274 [Trametes sanguinea]